VTIATPTAPPPSAAPAAPADRPHPAAGLELLGRFEGSGLRDARYLARRRDGEVIQLSRLLYLVAEAADGRRDADAIAARVGPRIGRRVSAGNVRFLVERKLRPLGVLAAGDGSTPELSKQPSLLALHYRRPLIRPRAVRALALAFAPLFASPLVVIVLAALAAFDVWLFGMHGIAQGLRTVLYEPTLLLALVLSVIAATAFHEVGHAAACRYGGGRPGAIGAGLYLVWPAFYCDVTDAYRLDRRGRLRTDLGGIYFNAVTALLAGGAYFATGHEWLLLLAVVQHLTMLHQLLPLLRFDGYYVLSDLTGVPDILSRIGPILRSLVPFRPVEPKVRELKPWVRLVVTSYIVVLVPLLLLMLTWIVMGAPRIFATAFDSLGVHAARVAETVRQGEWSLTALSSLQIVLLVLQCAGIALVISRAGRSAMRRLWRWSSDSVRRRAVVLAGTAAVTSLVVATWWPDGDYQPLRPGERGTVPEGISELRDVPDSRLAYSVDPDSRVGAVPREAVERGGAIARDDAPVTGVPSDRDPIADDRHQPPVQDEPAPPPAGTEQQAPTAPAAESPSSPAAPTTAEPTTPAASKDNAAVATNTVDGSLVFRLAFDLRFILDGAIDHSNAAVAYASCDGCRTIAIAIQVLIAMGELQTIAPTNTAVAINDRCPSCETLAYAYQLVFGLPDILYLTQEGRAEIATILAALVLLGSSDAPIDELRVQIDALMLELRDVVARELVLTKASEQTASHEPAPTREQTATPEPEPSTAPPPEQTSTPEPTQPPASDHTPSPSPAPTSTPTPEPTASPAPSTTPTPTPESSATPTPTP
jgi:putative peptide zinc metalloprotease protein